MSDRSRVEAEERLWSRPETVSLGFGQSPVVYLLLAVHHANASVEIGLVSPITLVVGSKLRQIGSALGADIEQAAKRGKRFLPLWRAVSRRYAEVRAEERRRQPELDQKPGAYVCAAEGCGIRGEKKVALCACGGRCPPDLKPHYCGTQCQRKVNISGYVRAYIPGDCSLVYFRIGRDTRPFASQIPAERYRRSHPRTERRSCKPSKSQNLGANVPKTKKIGISN